MGGHVRGLAKMSGGGYGSVCLQGVTAGWWSERLRWPPGKEEGQRGPERLWSQLPSRVLPTCTPRKASLF